MYTKDTIQLLQKNLSTVPQIICDRSLRLDLDDLVAMQFQEKKLAIIQDNATAIALGDQVVRALKGRFDVSVVTLHLNVSAEAQAVDYIREQTRGCDSYIAVGSGTINDLTKYASFKENKPYIVFPTAASMNGFCSANASITENGFKKTLPSHMPKAVFCDLSVIAQAPVRLNRSGLGDSIARPTAQFDWLLSHLVLGTAYNDVPFALLSSLEDELFANARGIGRGDPQSIRLLIETLLLSGLGMTIAGGSYPASQSEHMISHSMHMLKDAALPQTFHGEEIAVTTLTSARIQQKLLRSQPLLRSSQFDHSAIELFYGGNLALEAQSVYNEKQQRVAASTLHDWESIANTLEKIIVAPSKLEAVLKAADAPLQPEAIGWDLSTYNIATRHAHYLRDRFTCLDINPG